MQEVTKYPSGTFSWVDLATTDQEGAKAFYTKLFGWEAEDVPMGEDSFYTMLNINGKSVAALSTMQAAQQEQGVPPYWTSYISVDNVDEIAGKVDALGGMVLAPPFDVFDSGRMALIADPGQAMFGLWQPKNHIGASYVNVPNTLVWNELMTRNLEKAKAFYTGLLDWEAQTQDMPTGPYTTFTNNGRMGGGMMEMGAEFPASVPSHWMVYFRVEDCDAMAKKAEELGGKLHVPPQDIPNIGRFSLVQDPQGGMFTIMYMPNADDPPSA